MKDFDKIIAELVRQPDRLYSLEPRKFEELVAELFAANGYDVQVTRPTRDGGYDIMVVRKDALGVETTMLVECKRYSKDNPVGVAIVRGLKGVKDFLGVSKGILVTTSFFSTEAKKLVGSAYDLQLVDFDQLQKWLAAYSPPLDKVPYSSKHVFYSCFISSSTKDREFVEKLNGSLRDAGVKVWYAPEELKPGEKLHDQIRKAIRSFDKVLLILSPSSMQSDWVVTEIRHAREREKEEQRQILFPISITSMSEIKNWTCFDADSGKDLAVEVREYFIPDFSEWKRETTYHSKVSQLLQGLIPEQET